MQQEGNNAEPIGPIVTFHAPGRTFQRVFKDASLDETKQAVRQKLGLPQDTAIRLVRVQNGQNIDLEDDEDFEAFRALARPGFALDVSVAVGPSRPPELDGRKRKRDHLESPTLAVGASRPPTIERSLQKLGAFAAGPDRGASAVSSDKGEVPRKRRKKNRVGVAQSGTEDSNGPIDGRLFDTVATKKGANALQEAPDPSPSSSKDVAVPDSGKRRERKSVHSPSLSEELLVVASSSKSLPMDVQDTAGSSHQSIYTPKTSKRKRVDMIAPRVHTNISSLGNANGDMAPQTKPASPLGKTKLSTDTDDQPADSNVKPYSLAQTSVVQDRPGTAKKKRRKKQSRAEDPQPDPTNTATATEVSRQVPVTPVDGPPKEHRKEKKRDKPDADGTKKNTNITSSRVSPEVSSPAKPSASGASDRPVKVHKSKKQSQPVGQSLQSAAPLQQVDSEKSVSREEPDETSKTQKGSKRKRKGSEALVTDSLNAAADKVSGSAEIPSTTPVEDEPIPAPVIPATAKKGKKRKALASTDTKSSTKPADQSAAESSADLWANVVAAAEAVLARNAAAATTQKVADAPTSISSPSIEQTVAAERSAGVKPVAKADARRKKTYGENSHVTPSAVEKNSINEPATAPDDVSPRSEAASSPSTSALAPVADAVHQRRMKKGKSAMSLSCPVCKETPFHLRFECPTVLAGADSIQKRVTELRQDGADAQLIEELEVLLSKAQRKNTTSDLSPSVAVVTQTSETSSPVASGKVQSPEESEDHVHPLSRGSSPPLTQLSERLPLSARALAGSEIAEVAIQGQDEGSSNDSSESDDESDDEDRPTTTFPATTDVASADMEALLRGPVAKRGILAEIPSESSSDEGADEEESDVSEDDDEALDQRFRRLSRKFARAESSSDEDIAADAITDNDDVVPPTFMDVDPQDAIDEMSEGTARPTSLSENPASGDEVEGEVAEVASVNDVEDEPVEGTENKIDDTASVDPDDGDVHMSGQIVDQPPSVSEKSQHVSEQSKALAKAESSSRTTEPATSPIVEDRVLGEDTPAVEAQKTVSSIIPPSEPDAVVESIQSTTVAPGHQDRMEVEQADPIETADDLPEAKMPSSHDDDDPIEIEGTPPPMEQRYTTPPPIATPRPGTVKRMKNRHGQLPDGDDDLPILASSLFENAVHSTPAQTNGQVDPQPEAGKESVARRTRNAARRSMSSTVSMPPPPDPVPVSAAPKRRGRQPLSEEEKARRAAEKAEKDRMAAEKKAAKEKEKAEKAAKKEVEKAERAAQREADKAEKARLREEKALAKKGGKGGKSKDVTASAVDHETSVEPTIPNVAVPSTPQVATAVSRPSSWTTLPVTQTPSFIEANSSMVDELQSSSPVHPASPLAGEVPAIAESYVRRQVDEDADQEVDDDNLTGLIGRQPPEATQESQTTDYVPDSDPLFLPGSSQFPTPFPGTQRAAPRRGVSLGRPSSEKSGSDNEKVSAIVPKRPTRVPRWSSAAPFRRLSDLASSTLFASPSLSNDVSFSLTPAPKAKVLSGLSSQGGDDEESDDEEDEETGGSDSDSDEGRSHIPRERRAGAGVRKKKATGLLAFAK